MARQSRLDSLTGLRFFAALVVLAFHFDIIFFARSPSLRTAPKLFDQGTVGVSFFFILSGFVLAWSHRAQDSPASFFRRRLARIGPLQVATWAIMLAVVTYRAPWPGTRRALVSLVLLDPWSSHWTTNLAVNAPAWSLGCELFFYLLFPLLFAGLSRARPAARRGLALVCVAAPALIALAVGAGGGPTAVTRWLQYFFPPTRLLEFVLGMVLALEMSEGRLPRIGLLPATAVAVIAYVGDGQLSAAWQPVAVTVVPFALLIVAAAQADVAGRTSVFRLRPLVALGVWSFALYMGHLTVLDLMSDQLHQLGRGGTVVVGAAYLGLSIAFAWFLHAVVERPLEGRLRGARPRPEAEPHPTAVLHPAVETAGP